MVFFDNLCVLSVTLRECSNYRDLFGYKKLWERNILDKAKHSQVTVVN